MFGWFRRKHQPSQSSTIEVTLILKTDQFRSELRDARDQLAELEFDLDAFRDKAAALFEMLAR